MTDQTILIRNVYVMLAYAFRAIHSDGSKQLATETFDTIHDLLAEILVRGVGTQVKRGLHHDYQTRHEELATVRGRIHMSATFASRSMTRGRLACEFDEYQPDTPHNQALKSVLVLLIRHGDVTPSRKDALRRLLPYLDGITLIAPTSIRWNALHYHRANATYRLLLGVCELVVRGLLQTQDAGSSKLQSWISDDAMSSLYERFLREYFTVHHPALAPAAPTVNWDYDHASAEGTDQLPTMRTDVTLRHGSRTLIIDAKYYRHSMQISQWGKESVHSAHLYQILTYAKNADTSRDGSVSGLLLYARTTAPRQPNLDITIQGTRIGAHTLDLTLPWETLSNQLDNLTTWLDR